MIPWVAILIYITRPPSRNSWQSRLFLFHFVYFCLRLARKNKSTMLRKPWVTLTLVIRIHSSYVYASVRVFETSHSKYFRWYWWWLLNKQTNKHYHYVPLIMCNQCLKEQAYPGKCRRAGRPERRRTRCSAPTPRCCPWPRAPPHSPLRRISVESPITWDRWVKFAFSLVPKSILIQASPLRVTVLLGWSKSVTVSGMSL